MGRTYRQYQKGISAIGFVVIVALAVAVFAIGGQSLPIALEYQAAKKAALKVVKAGGTHKEMREAFDRAAHIDSIHAISGQDLHITTVDERVVLSFAYAREIPLVGPAYLVYRFNYQTP